MRFCDLACDYVGAMSATEPTTPRRAADRRQRADRRGGPGRARDGVGQRSARPRPCAWPTRPAAAAVRGGLSTPPGQAARAEAQALLESLDAAGRRDIARAEAELDAALDRAADRLITDTLASQRLQARDRAPARERRALATRRPHREQPRGPERRGQRQRRPHGSRRRRSQEANGHGRRVRRADRAAGAAPSATRASAACAGDRVRRKRPAATVTERDRRRSSPASSAAAAPSPLDVAIVQASLFVVGAVIALIAEAFGEVSIDLSALEVVLGAVAWIAGLRPLPDRLLVARRPDPGHAHPGDRREDDRGQRGCLRRAGSCASSEWSSPRSRCSRATCRS